MKNQIRLKALFRSVTTTFVMVALMSITCLKAQSAPAKNSANQLKGSGGGKGAKIIQNQPLWWFNGETTAQYHETASLKLINAPIANYSWAITTGANKIAISRRSAMEIGVKTIGASAPAAKVTKDIVVTVTLNGKTIATHKSVVYRPYVLKYKYTLDGTTIHDPANPTETLQFTSVIVYDVMNQFNNRVPRNMPLSEDFDRNAVKDDWAGSGSMNWIAPYPNGEGGYGDGTEDTQLWDTLGSAWGPGLNPQPVPPTDPKALQKIMHFSGYWSAGSQLTGRGAQLRSLHWANYTYVIWRFYRGVGRHE